MENNRAISLEERKTQGKPVVLVVDDDPTHHKLMELLADRLSFSAHVTSSCAQAIEALRLFSFDLILMDYRMPETDGCRCTQAIRAMKDIQQVPIIAVTAHLMRGSREECIECGMNDFLPKPFTLEALHDKVNYWLQQKTELKQ